MADILSAQEHEDSSSRPRHASSNGGVSAPPGRAPPEPPLVLWRAPLTTLLCATLQCGVLLRQAARHMWQLRHTLLVLTVATATAVLIPGPHRTLAVQAAPHVYWYGYWIWLGILSSVGFGSGLHTFVLFLAPFILRVAAAGRACGGLAFPAPPYPASMPCPPGPPHYPGGVPLLAMMIKVLPEALSWGFGTALGELPPYFMARTARLSGRDVDQEVLEMQELQRRQKEGKPLSLSERMRVNVEWAVECLGFFGILLCASIPNPLFDLAGVMCGHCLVPFSTFFGATVIGKAGFKMLLQTGFVILVSDEALIGSAVALLGRVPAVGPGAQRVVLAALEKQRSGHAGGGSWVSWCFDKFIVLMVAYFAVSILNSAAQTYRDSRAEKGQAHRD